MRFLYLLALLCNVMVVGGLALCLYVGHNAPSFMPDISIGSVIGASFVAMACTAFLFLSVIMGDDTIRMATITITELTEDLKLVLRKLNAERSAALKEKRDALEKLSQLDLKAEFVAAAFRGLSGPQPLTSPEPFETGLMKESK